MAVYILGDLVNIISESIPQGSTSGFERFVGLEHYDSGEPVITRYGSTEMLESSVKHFLSGDILVARRNVYLKRAGIVHFEGVTSGDSIVLRVKDERFRDILPFVLNTDDFWDYAEQNSDGTMSKRLSPADLADYEFELPSIEEQRILANKLWAAYRLKEAYKKLLLASQEMVKAKFNKMFGNILSNKQKYALKFLRECCIINPRKPILSIPDDDMVSFIPMTSVSENGLLQDVSDAKYGQVKQGYTYFENNDVLFAKITPCMENGKGAIAENLTNNIGMGSTEFHVLRPINGISNPYWILALTRMPNFRKRAAKFMTGTGGQKRVSEHYLSNFQVGLPPIELQDEFAKIYQQAGKTQAALRNSIEAIDNVIKSLINA